MLGNGCSKKFTDAQTYSNTIQSIDEKKMTVLGVSTAIAGSATLLAAVPDDATTPLAEEMMDLSSYLVIVVCVLVLEKSLLTVFGAVSCYALFPLAGLFTLLFIIKNKAFFLSLAIKLTILALVVLTIVPTAMMLSDYIYEVNQVSIEQEVDAIADAAEIQAEAESDPTQKLPWYKKLWGAVTEAVTSTADKAIEGGKQALNKFIDAVSVFVIAYCAIPIFIVFLFLWLLKLLFNIDTTIDFDKINPRKLRNKGREKERTALTE